MKKSKRIIFIQPYGRKCLVLVGFRNLKEQVQKHKMGRELTALIKNDPPTKGDDGALYHDNSGRYILWLPNKKATRETIQHEATHLVEYIHKYVGEGNAHEYRAYFPGWFYKEVKKALR